MSKYNVVLFDFDGTLANTAKGVFSSACYAINTMYGTNLKNEDVEDFMGPPLLESFLRHGFPENDFPRFIELYGYYYDTYSIENTTFYDGAEECLRGLKKMGIRVGIASTKTIAAINEILKVNKLEDYIEVVAATEMLGEVVEKADMINKALDKMQVSRLKERILMVGDRYLDAQGAEETGIDFIAITCSGLTDISEFNQFRVLGFFDSLESVENFIIG